MEPILLIESLLFMLAHAMKYFIRKVKYTYKDNAQSS
jgi:hypothetical protein